MTGALSTYWLRLPLAVFTCACSTPGGEPAASGQASAQAAVAERSVALSSSAAPVGSMATPVAVWTLPPAAYADFLVVPVAACSRSEAVHLGTDPGYSYTVDAPSASRADLHGHLRAVAKSLDLPVQGADDVLGVSVAATAGKAGIVLMNSQLFLTFKGAPPDSAKVVGAMISEGPPQLGQVIDSAGIDAVVDVRLTRFSSGPREVRVELRTKKTAADLGKAAALHDLGDGLFATPMMTKPNDWYVSLSATRDLVTVTAAQSIPKDPACALAEHWSPRAAPSSSVSPGARAKQEDDLMKEMMGE